MPIGLWTILLSALRRTLLRVPSYLTVSMVPRSESHQNSSLAEGLMANPEGDLTPLAATTLLSDPSNPARSILGTCPTSVQKRIPAAESTSMSCGLSKLPETTTYLLTPTN